MNPEEAVLSIHPSALLVLDIFVSSRVRDSFWL